MRALVVLSICAVCSRSSVAPHALPYAASGRKYCVEGMHLRVGMEAFESPPYVLRNPSGEWVGLSVDILTQLSVEAGFTFEISDYAKRDTETWDGVFSRSLDNYDLIGSWWFQKHSRSALGDFLPPYVDSQ